MAHRAQMEQNVGVTLEQSEMLGLLRLEGAIEIDCAAELKKLLLEALASGKQVRVSLADASELGVTAVQLMWAAKREARESSVGFVSEGQVPESVSAALAEAGFERFAATGETN